MWAMGYGMWYMGDEAESESESAYCVRVDNCRDDDGNDEGQWNRSIRIAVGGPRKHSGAFDSSWAKIFNDWHDCLSYLMTFSSAGNRPR